MTRSHIRPAVLLALVLASGSDPALGDGSMLPLAPEYMYETTQTAYLDWNAGAGREQLTILPGFRGDARDFVWLVPLPAEPAIAAGEVALFRSLQAATGPIWRDRDDGWDCDRGGYYADDNAGGGVTVVSDQVIDVYRVLVVRAEDAGALTDSLLAWGHLNPTNAAEVTPILADYVSEGWAFAAARVDSAAFVAAYPDAASGSWYRGRLRPLVFGFAADRPVYPMRLSRVSADTETWVELYVEADHRYEHPRLDAVYANRFTTDELAELRRRYPRAAEPLATGRFLTRLQGVLSPADMDEDFYLRRAADDREFRSIRYSGWPATGLLLGGTVLAWAMGRWRRRRG